MFATGYVLHSIYSYLSKLLLYNIIGSCHYCIWRMCPVASVDLRNSADSKRFAQLATEHLNYVQREQDVNGSAGHPPPVTLLTRGW